MNQYRNHTLRKSLVVIISVCLFGYLAIVSTGCAKHKKPAESIADIQKREGIPVRTITMQPGILESIENAGGTAEGFFQTTVNSIGAGRITVINVKVGDYVEKNTSLMTIQPDASQTFALSQIQLDNAEKNRDRIKKMVELGGASQEMLDNAESALSAAQESVGSMKKSEFMLTPFAGTITAVYPSPNSIIAKEKPLVDIASMDKIRLSVTVSELVVNRFKTGQSATVVVGSDTVHGAVGEVSLAGSQSHTFTVDILFNNKNRVIKPGMYLTARVVVARKNDVLSLPIETVLNDAGGSFVYVVTNKIAHRAPVTLGMRGEDRYEIMQGLLSGDVVVTDGASNLSDSARVNIVP